jgi:hypothetical protein
VGFTLGYAAPAVARAHFRESCQTSNATTALDTWVCGRAVCPAFHVGGPQLMMLEGRWNVPPVAAPQESGGAIGKFLGNEFGGFSQVRSVVMGLLCVTSAAKFTCCRMFVFLVLLWPIKRTCTRHDIGISFRHKHCTADGGDWLHTALCKSTLHCAQHSCTARSVRMHSGGLDKTTKQELKKIERVHCHPPAGENSATDWGEHGSFCHADCGACL